MNEERSCDFEIFWHFDGISLIQIFFDYFQNTNNFFSEQMDNTPPTKIEDPDAENEEQPPPENAPEPEPDPTFENFSDFMDHWTKDKIQTLVDTDCLKLLSRFKKETKQSKSLNDLVAELERIILVNSQYALRITSASIHQFLSSIYHQFA